MNLYAENALASMARKIFRNAENALASMARKIFRNAENALASMARKIFCNAWRAMQYRLDVTKKATQNNCERKQNFKLLLDCVQTFSSYHPLQGSNSHL
ncbi:hypothetical protein AVEN_13465-1 [Araneus ventricosus]|uniref:Uncharacterized protein n=1 Tax=Araneus ventricosus TaxID=182803 RepID=A0A4Y2IVC4_ARAVE|nr:hypothetical protein AVEN_13465-1 [Araneus ventricosus]